ncbi:chromate transporter [Limnohabitans sp. MMS-10A-160]|jgi:chromate transporter|uniref:chromate transporter n=1 Tax=unclassified Limnohabitans TaxID=2626134 RepID=UPI000D3CFE80|nr:MULTISPECIES: chromate transporter [unclassified Limnohabitans]PUE22181.1 chromate transporter [Limnohabitans sp. MMS-10A-192]PUE25831.1 chromate transporter [Limnohabitans sp. MMS-10A-160]
MPDQVPLNQPQSKTDLFVSFTVLALQGFGGVLAVVQRELVEKKRWMTREQFIEDWAVAQILPGPNVINLSLMIGGRYFGLGGALAGVAGMLMAPLVVVLLLAMVFGSVSDAAWAQGALRGMGAVSAGLIAAVGLKMIAALRANPMGMPVCIGLAAASFVGVGILRWPLASVLLGTGLVACSWAYWQLAKQAWPGARP